MRRLLALAVVIAVSAPAVVSTQASRAADEKQIIANERQINGAFAKGDTATFLSLLAPEAYALDPMGGVMKAADFVPMMKEMKIESWNIDQSSVRFASPTVAIHTYRWTGKGTAMGQPFPSPTLASTVWVKQGAKWLALFHQETPVTPPPAKK